MDMTRDFIEKLQEMDAPHIVETELNGLKFCDKKLYRVQKEAKAAALLTETLTSIVDYIKSGADSNALKDSGRFIVHINDYNSVELLKELNSDKDRDCLVKAKFETGSFDFGEFVPVEQFIISLQAAFVQDENTAKLLQFVSSIKSDSSVQQNDDGVGQSVEVRRGISLAQKVTAPNPVTLHPYRTFPEVEQPESRFVFRIKHTDSGAFAALFPADGDRWKHTAITSIADYFKDNLGGTGVIVLA